jgi:tetratricopeptide (TPR) repeat protein
VKIYCKIRLILINYNLRRKGNSLKGLKLVVITCCFVLAACAEMEVKEKNTVLITKEKVETKKQPIDSKTAISPKVMFLLLTAELAEQRGQYELALDGYLQVAAIVNDLKVIKRASSIAIFLHDEKSLDKAVNYWLAIDANDLDARQLKAIVAIQTGKADVAIEQVNFILTKVPNDFDVRMQGVISVLRSPKTIKFAYDVFSELSKQYPNNESFYVVMAYLNYRSKDFTTAQVNLVKALAIKKGWIKALLLQGQVYIDQKKLALATKSLQQVVEKKENIQISKQIVQLLIHQNRFKEALNTLMYLQKKVPENNVIKIQTALVLLQIDEVSKEAELLLLKLAENLTYKNQSYYYLGRIAASKNQKKVAINWFNAVEESKYQYEAKISVVLLLTNGGDLTEALIQVRKIKLKHPGKHSELVLIEAELLSRDKKYQQAFDVLSGGLLKDEKNSDILYARALMAEKLGNIKSLEEDLKYILEKNSYDAAALNVLGYTLADKTSRYKEAKLYIERALAINPSEAAFIDSYGWLFYKMGNHEIAKKYLEKAYSLQQEAEIAGHLVEVLVALNRHNEAKEWLKKALEKNKHDQYLLVLKKQLINE